MVSVNPLTKEIQLKLVYYGPGLGGKTTTLQHIHDTTDEGHRGRLVSLATPVERTLYFDYLPVTLPKVGNFSLKLQLFTVPGQIHFNATRKLVLSKADGVIFVADSQSIRLDANIESLENLVANLREYNVDYNEFPILFQYNKRDLENIDTIDELNQALNETGRPAIPTCAVTGENVYQGLEIITKNVLKDLKRRNILGQEKKRTTKELMMERDGGETGNQKPQSPLEDAVSKATEREKPEWVSASRPNEGPVHVDRPTIPAPFALSERSSQDQNSISDGLQYEPFSFLPFWPEPARMRAKEIEAAISEGRKSDAMSLINTELNLIISVHKRGMTHTSSSTVIAMLGLDDYHYRAISEQVSLPENKLNNRMVLSAYLFLLFAVDKSR